MFLFLQPSLLFGLPTCIITAIITISLLAPSPATSASLSPMWNKWKIQNRVASLSEVVQTGDDPLVSTNVGVEGTRSINRKITERKIRMRRRLADGDRNSGSGSDDGEGGRRRKGDWTM